jgi:NAD(P)-dependent dehydrogenase (short-subunit alcohol dehydrogenase family)
MSARVEMLQAKDTRLVDCDLADSTSVQRAASALRRLCSDWDVLVMCPGNLDPVGPFLETDFTDWERSIRINFTGQLQMTRELMPARRQTSPNGPCVLFFAGGGTNSAPTNYSAYTISKIALIKMCELLDAEIPDTRFAIVGPGWVKTKIHQATLAAGERAGAGYDLTREHLRTGDFTSMEQVLNCCDWIIESGRDVIGGRNFSVVHDKWNTHELADQLRRDPDLFKLRRRQ